MRFTNMLPILCLLAGCGLTQNNDDPKGGNGNQNTGPTQPNTNPTGSTATQTVTTGDGTTQVEVPGCAEVPNAAEEILVEACAACHGPESDAYGDFGDATDPVALIENGWVVPGDPAGSKIFEEIYAETMPTAQGGGPLTAEQIGTIQQWIQCGAEDWTDDGLASARGFITPEAVFEGAFSDVVFLPDSDITEPDQANARYLSLVNLYNAGVPADDIEAFGQALHKLMWSLTTEDNPPLLEAVDLDGLELDDGSELSVADGLGDKLLFRVDLREFGWEAGIGEIDKWEVMVADYEFGIRYDDEFDVAEDVTRLTGSRIPIVNGDWFVGNASVPPLYFDLLNIPDNFNAFFDQFGGIDDIQADFDNFEVDCAGMDATSTLVSKFNRVQCRHDSTEGYCWESFDFAGEAGDQNIFLAPNKFLEAKAGGEAFCALPDGMQAYFVFLADGTRLNEAPTNVVVDYTPGSDGVVITGLHCMNCHNAGVITRDDQILTSVLENESAFDNDVVDLVTEWFPGNADLTEIYQDDIDQFVDALETDLNIPVDQAEPTWALAEDYDTQPDVVRVASDLGIPEAQLEPLLSINDQLQAAYSSLLSGGEIARETFEGLAQQTICDLELGDECDVQAFCGESSVPCLDGSVCNQQIGACTNILE
ncbi:MAG: hypothetical protein ABMB14_14900 [Myxococcota bacterium]